MIVDIIKEYVETACKGSNNVFGFNFLEEHIFVVANYAAQLAEILCADTEIVKLSAYLHDIAVIYDFSAIKEHEVIGSNIAENVLLQNAYPKDKIQIVKKCIMSHSKVIQLGNGTTEEICLSNADALSKISNPAYWLYFAYNIRKLCFNEGKQWYLNMIDSNWNSIIEPAKELIRDKYILVKSLLA